MPSAFMILLFATVAAAPTIPAQLDAILKNYRRADAPGASVLVAQGGKVQSLTSSVLEDGGIYSAVEDLWRWDQALYGTRLLRAVSDQ
jgi:hypothetical protein